MSKKLLVDEVADRFDSRTAAERAVDTVFDGVEKLLRGGESVSIKGFGTFKVKDRAARTARNPRTGESIDVAAKRVVVLDSKIEL